MKRESFIIRRSYYEPMKKLGKDERGQLLDAICEYALNGIEPDNLSPIASMAFNFIGPGIERDYLTYEMKAEKNRENGKLGGRPPKKQEEPKKPCGLTVNSEKTIETLSVSVSDSDSVSDSVSDSDIKKRKTKVFVPPSLSEIKDFFSQKIKEKGLLLDPGTQAEKFESFYESKGWKVGNQKMVDWKKSASGWILRATEAKGQSKQQINGYQSQTEPAL